MHVILPTAVEIASALEYLHSNNVLHGAPGVTHLFLDFLADKHVGIAVCCCALLLRCSGTFMPGILTIAKSRVSTRQPAWTRSNPAEQPACGEISPLNLATQHTLQYVFTPWPDLRRAGDLTTNNVLLVENEDDLERPFSVKVSDFGLSRVHASESAISTNTFGTVRLFVPDLTSPCCWEVSLSAGALAKLPAMCFRLAWSTAVTASRFGRLLYEVTTHTDVDVGFPSHAGFLYCGHDHMGNL
jgi:serine/threonine protein kinase